MRFPFFLSNRLSLAEPLTNLLTSYNHCGTLISADSRIAGLARSASQIRLIRDFARPYGGTLLIILPPMLVETAMSHATPWPLKVIIDNVAGHHKMSPWLADIFRPGWMMDG